jgi:hypothetical protein
MSVRYVSYDIQKGNDYGDLRAFIKKHKGKAITQSLFRFTSEVDLGTFRDELGDAAQGDETVCVIIRTKDGLTHGRAAQRGR